MNPAALLFALALVAGPAPQSAPSRDHSWVVHAAIAAQGIGQFTDVTTTMYGIGTGRFREANPLLAWAADRPVAMGITKGLLAAGATYGLVQLHRTKPKTALVAAIGLTVLQGWVTWRNSETLRRHP